MPFAAVYPHYIHKAEKKGRSRDDVDTIICWLTGYDQKALQHQIGKKTDFETFFLQAPQQSECFKNYRGHMRLSCGGNRRQTHAKDPIFR